jgi:hypothetical protein
VTTRASAAAGSGRLTRLASSGLVWGGLVSCALAAWILFGLDGRSYYGTRLAVRAYEPQHRLLRPSGIAGQSFGVAGTVLMLVPFAYVARKRLKPLRAAGAVRHWLELHLFCGIVGPVLVTFHTSFKFNGIISAAYWSMVTVMLSGFAGRYLYVRIPRSIRGQELTRAELDARAASLRDEVAASVGSAAVMDVVDRFEADVLPAAGGRLSLADQIVGELRVRRQIHALEMRLQAAGVPPATCAATARVMRDRVLLLRRRAYLERTKALFGLWHVFHLPLVYLLLAIATAHIALVLYMGYVPFRW